MNAAIRAVVRTALGRGAEVFGVQHGYDGLVENEIRQMASTDVGGIISHGGTLLRSARSESFRTVEGMGRAAANLRELGVTGLVVIGGDGSLRGALEFANGHGLAVMGVPGSIDNDIPCTDYSIGFQTAVDTALDAIDRVRDTAYSHERVFVIEVMGRRNGFIALEAGLAGGAEAILIPELPFSLQEVCDKLKAGTSRGKRSSIIVVAEGAAKAQDVCEFISNHTGDQARYLVLGHMQRGGSPNAFDRVLATRLGAAAVTKLLSGVGGEMVGLESGRIVSTALDKALSDERRIDPERLRLAEVMAQ
jgi:6-phosphofructokinase 1